MKIIEPSVKLMRDFDGEEIMKFIEQCGRTCYQSEARITENSAETFIRNIIRNGHESVLEHFSCTFEIICDRGVMAELTRHRICSFSVESTRFCDYQSNAKFGSELTFIKPCFWEEDSLPYKSWQSAAKYAEEIYLGYREIGNPPEQARSILPNSLKTQVIMTANLREWRTVLKLRTSKRAHPQMRQIALMILDVLKEKLPVVFEDINHDGKRT